MEFELHELVVVANTDSEYHGQAGHVRAIRKIADGLFAYTVEFVGENGMPEFGGGELAKIVSTPAQNFVAENRPAEFKPNDTVVTHTTRESRNAGTVGEGSVGVVTVAGIELQDGLEDGSCSGVEVVFDGGRVYAEYKPSELSHAAGNPVIPEDVANVLKEDRPAELKKFRTDDPLATAIALVNALYYKGELPTEDVYIVWFCATLQNWKALVSTNVKDNSYYEVTHNGDKKETYVDKYVKHDHYTIPDSFLQN